MQFVRFLARGLVCLLCSGALTLAHARVSAIDQAQAEWTLNGTTTSASVSLPYGWDYHHRGQSGLARFTLEFDSPTTVDQPWALYFHRLGNAYVVKLNGVLLEQNGALDEPNSSDYAKVPRFVPIPPSALLAHNRLEVTIRSDSGRRSGMPVVWVGPKGEVEPRYRDEFALRVGSSGVLAVFSLIVGLIAAVLWATQTDPRPERRGVRDSLYLFAAMAELAWAFFISDTLIERPPLPWDWWSVAINMTLGIWLSSLLMFCHTIAGWRQHRASQWVQRLLGVLIVTGPALALGATNAKLPQLLTLWQAAFALVFVPSTLLFLFQARRQASMTHRLVALAFLINVPIGLHDFYAMRIGDPFSTHALLRYSATLFGLTLGAIAIGRFRSANLRVRSMLDTLAVRIEDKEHELAQTYSRMEVFAREQERVLERSRILRDMHDGVGSHISAAIRQLQSGNAKQEDVLLTLRDSLDQLKLSIDALNLPAGDVTALLANLRYRLEPRFLATGLALEWAVVELPNLARLDAGAMRQLQFIFFETFSNVMQHAHASILRIEATPADGGTAQQGAQVRIRIVDNGCGFDTGTRRRRGLASMQERANAIGAHLTITSQPGQTKVELLLA